MREQLVMQARAAGLSLSAFVHARLFEDVAYDGAPDVSGRLGAIEGWIAEFDGCEDRIADLERRLSHLEELASRAGAT